MAGNSSNGRFRPRRVQGILREFLQVEAAGGFALMSAAIIAVVWANTLTDTYHDVWEWEITLGSGDIRMTVPFWDNQSILLFQPITEHLSGWVNDALMTIFFFLVGLEVKREFVAGELRDPRAAALPILAAAGGMIVPAAIFAALNYGGEGIDGWAIPVATDIAFVVGVLALFGPRLPSGLRVFLLTLAIADDIGGIVIIAVFYTSGIEPGYLLAAGGGFALIVALQMAGLRYITMYAVIGVAVWYYAFESGVHATISGVVLGLLTPARPYRGHRVMEQIEHRLLPYSNFIIVPIFALANAGVVMTFGTLEDAFSESVAWGIVLGLIAGKTGGVFLATFLGVRLGIGRIPAGVTLPHALGGAMLAGIGFTVALFIAELSYDDHVLLDQAKIGVFAGSLAAGIAGALFLYLVARARPTPPMTTMT